MKPRVALSELQLFAVPAHCVAKPDEQEAQWLWWGDNMIPVSKGFFVIQPSGVLVFEPRNDDYHTDENSDR